MVRLTTDRSLPQHIATRLEVRVDEFGDGRPQQFFWQGRMFHVNEVVAHWLEGVDWWERFRDLHGGHVVDDRVDARGERPSSMPHIGWEDREVWQVEARCVRFGQRIQAEIAHDVGTGCWHMIRVWD